MVIGDTYLYDLAGARYMDHSVPYLTDRLETDELRVWVSTTGPRCILIEAGPAMRRWADRQHVGIADCQASWDDLSGALSNYCGVK